jgi:3-phenylpropionate/trans-cinnamate dioxygenase ferredoxin subunit
MGKYVVAPVEEIAPGERKIVDVAGRSVGVFNLGGEFFALRNRCPHQGGPVCTGRVAGFLDSSEPGEYRYSRPGEVLRCPWHGWEFDIRNGQSWYDPLRPRVGRFRVSVEPGAAILESDEESAEDAEAPVPGLRKGPYVAETYPVTIEQEYIVVEIPDQR